MGRCRSICRGIAARNKGPNWRKGLLQLLARADGLGIAVAPAWRDVGIGSALMAMLHLAARVRGVKKVRLKVHNDNGRAIELYTRFGYQFVSEEAGQQVGFLEL